MVFSVHINSLEYFKTFQLPWIIMHCPLPSQKYDLFSSLLKFLKLITSASEPLPEWNRFNEKTLHPASFILNVKSTIMLPWGRCAITSWHSGYFCCKLSVKLNKLQTDINEVYTNKRAELFSPYVENSLLTTFYLFSDSLTTALKMSSNNIEFLIYQSQSKPTLTTFKLWINL